MTTENYIGYSISGKGTKTFQTIDPKENSANSPAFIEATSEEIETAVQLAAQAFPVYQSLAGAKRAHFLNAIADGIMALGDVLISRYMKETGLPEGRAKGERGRTVGQLRMFAELINTDDWRNPTIDTALPNRTPVPKPDLRQLLIPLGPVVVFGASNFPLAYSTAGSNTLI